ncbi:hypothetical protein AB1L42_02545 [Thalassoglobus sp. JC818]|uniref:fascin domain-containing protein n=1 Tax=Thalassoglobus sp. JC818 TaxID=3232136 RepID=UPI0034579870
MNSTLDEMTYAILQVEYQGFDLAAVLSLSALLHFERCQCVRSVVGDFAKFLSPLLDDAFLVRFNFGEFCMEKTIPIEGPFTTGIKSWKNGRYVAVSEKYSVLLAKSLQYSVREKFTFIPVDQSLGIYAIKAECNGKYVSLGQKDVLSSTSTNVGDGEKFKLHFSDLQTLALQSLKNNQWVCVDDEIRVTYGSNPQLTVTFREVLAANRPGIGLWEEFNFAPGIPF